MVACTERLHEEMVDAYQAQASGRSKGCAELKLSYPGIEIRFKNLEPLQKSVSLWQRIEDPGHEGECDTSILVYDACLKLYMGVAI